MCVLYITFLWVIEKMNKLKKIISDYYIYISAFAIPWIIVVIATWLGDGWITGGGTILNGDTAGQLVPFAYELWDKVHTGSDFSYTWNVAGGVDFSTIYGYYISPFTLLILMVPKNAIINMVQIVMILKWSFAGVAIVYFFYHTRFNTMKCHKKEVSLFLGMAFILSNSQINFIRYFQFGDTLICLPILLLLIERMAKEGKWKLYTAILTVCMLSNLYMAYEICIFLVVWFVFQLNYEIIDKAKKFFTFAVSSILSALISFFSIADGLITTRGRMDNTGIDERKIYALSKITDLKTFFHQFFFGARIHSPSLSIPNIYFSILGIMLVCLFPMIKISKKRKIFLMIWSFMLFLSFIYGAFSLVWHLFTPPNGVYHRFSNIYIFTMLILALYVLIHLREIKLLNVCLAGAVALLVYCVAFFTVDSYDSLFVYLITALLIALYFIILILYCKKSIDYNNLLRVLVFLGMLELSVNACIQFYDQYNSIVYSDETNQVSECWNMAEKVQLDVGERMSAISGMDNVGLLVSKPTISGFLSSVNGDMLALLERLGMGINGKVQYNTRGASPLINAMFNIRYMVAENPTEVSDAKVIDSNSICQLYKTDRLVGLGYMCDSNIVDWDPFSENCFYTQNSFAKLGTGTDENLFEIITPDVTCYDIDGKMIDRDDSYIGDNAYVYNYISKYGDENDTVQMSFNVDEDMDVYVDTRSSFNGMISVYVEGDLVGGSHYGYDRSTCHIGNVKKGQNVTLVVTALSDFYKDMNMSVFMRFSRFNEQAYTKVYDALCKDIYEIDRMDSNYIKGVIDAEKEGIMMTSIQSNVGFDVFVDGEKTNYETIGGALIGVPLDKGEHIVEFIYSGTKSAIGRIVSGVSILIYMILVIIGFYNNYHKEHNMQGD